MSVNFHRHFEKAVTVGEMRFLFFESVCRGFGLALRF